jgi:hypothetical protein
MGTGSAAPFTGGQQDAMDSASIQALAKVRKAVAPCPDCGWYQSSTIPALRERRFGWIRLAGLGLANAAGVAALVLLVQTMRGDRFAQELFGLPAMGLLAALAGFGGAFWYGHRSLAARFDPNAAWPKRVKHPGVEYAGVRTEEFQAAVDQARATSAAIPSGEWYVITKAGQHGPVSAPQLRGYVRRGQVAPTDRVWTEGIEEWLAAAAVFGES